MFAALVPPPDVVEDLDAFLEVRREAAPFRWTPAEHLHVTLAFLAEVPDRQLDDLYERLGRAAARRTPFPAVVVRGGRVPEPGARPCPLRRARPGGPRADRAGPVGDGVPRGGLRAGIAVDGQRFRAHLTVARCGRPTEVTPWVRLLDGYRGPAWQADRITLVASHLGEGPRRRPRYEEVSSFPLGRD